MMIRASAMMLIGAGVFLFVLTKMMPFFAFILMDWIGVISMIGGVVILLAVFPFSDTGLLYDSLPSGSCLIPYIRRDSTIRPLVGKRVFPGESFLEVKQAGIIEDLGVNTVFSWGRKRIRFALENLNYTPDPRFFNVCSELYRLGFDDEEDMKMILYGIPSLDPVRDRAKKAYYLDRMAQVNWNLDHSPPRGGERFVGLLKTYKTKDGFFGKRRYEKPEFKEEKKPEDPILEKIEEPKPQKKETPKAETEEQRMKRLLGE